MSRASRERERRARPVVVGAGNDGKPRETAALRELQRERWLKSVFIGWPGKRGCKC